MPGSGAIIAVSLLCAISIAPGQTVRTGLIDEIKRVERELGYGQTKVFSKTGAPVDAYYYCYYTEKLTLPDSYEGLRFERGAAAGCRVDPAKYDIFFYPMEAVASDTTRVTDKLAQASVERQAVVVSHEDFHVQEPIRKLPEPLAEAATTLAGFLTAAEYAKREAGESSDMYRRLSGEVELFLRKSAIVNQWHARLAALYQAARHGTMSRREALTRKDEHFAKLRQACEALPAPVSFNRCPAALNNAGLAFDATYTRYYPLFYAVFVARGRDPKSTIETITQAAAKPDPARFLREVR